ncbi:hypothetical protein JMUB6875_23470 [Nocardia sp. JMUB6875]|uniref:hypothetical protein n=1 Tax=Nocardia sp. JMUB6875 TaxID=3158170 RepID=UPI0032E70FD4
MRYTLSELIEMSSHTGSPARPTAEVAHEIMRLHRECLVGQCLRKTAAFETLVESGCVVPDSHRPR